MSQELDLRGLLEGRVKNVEEEVEATRTRVHGLTLGTVTSVIDPKFLGRVQVSQGQREKRLVAGVHGPFSSQ